jgi:hypothetical protein
MTIFYYLTFQTPPIWRARSPYLYPPGTGWPGYTPRHWVPFTSLPTTRRVTVEVFDTASTRVAKHERTQVKVKVSLRLTINQSVSFGVEPHLGLITRYLLLFESYGLVLCGVPSLTRGRVCLLYMLLALASAVFLGSESLGTASDLRLLFSSSPTTRRVTVEVFDPASTRVYLKYSCFSYPSYNPFTRTDLRSPLLAVPLLVHACPLPRERVYHAVD